MLATDLHGHLALVTGATGGIGKSTCRTLAALGCDVAVHYHRAAGTAEQLVAELKSMAVEAKAFQADLSNYDNVSPSAACVCECCLWSGVLLVHERMSCLSYVLSVV